MLGYFFATYKRSGKIERFCSGASPRSVTLHPSLFYHSLFAPYPLYSCRAENGGEASGQRDVASKSFLSFLTARYPLCWYRAENGGEASGSRRVRLCRRERTWTYVTKTKRKPDAETRRLYVVLDVVLDVEIVKSQRQGLNKMLEEVFYFGHVTTVQILFNCLFRFREFTVARTQFF